MKRVIKKASKLTDAERSEIEILHGKTYSARAIATVLGRSPNTVAAELKRNSHGNDGRTAVAMHGKYNALTAKQKAYVRRQYATYQGKKIQEDARLRAFIIAKLMLHWNPDEISGYMKAHPELGFYASKTTIYEWLYSEWGQSYCEYLASARYHPKKRKTNKPQRTMIPDRTSVHDRPAAIEERIEAGHWEFDSVVSSKRSGSTAALAVAQERTSRLLRVSVVPTLRPAAYAVVITQLVTGHAVLSLTTDNGIENRSHQLITTLLPERPVVYFTDPYSSYQKGGVENGNKMLRKYFPKGTDFSTISQTDVVEALTRINNKPRKILGYRSSLQVAKEKGIVLTATEGVLIGG
jgi:IS30 family transposase